MPKGLRRGLVLGAAGLLAIAALGRAGAAEPPLAALTPLGSIESVFAAPRDGCDALDIPDAPLRAIRTPDGVVAFGLHHNNRAFRGPDLHSLKIDCAVVLPSAGLPDPAAYNDLSWIAATWSEDGRIIQALLHQEFHAESHLGACSLKEALACWYNTILAVRSNDGGATFIRPERPAYVAGFPWKQEVGQGRYRGFFSPSNIFADGGRHRFFVAFTSGWPGQARGACLFRSDDPADPASWRAWDGKAFSVRFRDPYRDGRPNPVPACKTIGPFPGIVGSIVRHRPTGAWIAVFQGTGLGFAPPGLYYSASHDLFTWDRPRLLVEASTIDDDACKAKTLVAYPSLLDPRATGRNFDDVGDDLFLYYTKLHTENCAIGGQRELVRQRMRLKVWP